MKIAVQNFGETTKNIGRMVWSAASMRFSRVTTKTMESR